MEDQSPKIPPLLRTDSNEINLALLALKLAGTAITFLMPQCRGHAERDHNMTDFCITRVRYNTERTHITYVEVSENLPKEFGPKRTVSRGFVADLIRLKKASFSTWVRTEGGYSKGADVHVLEDAYLSTDRNSSKRDNLGSLPEF